MSSNRALVIACGFEIKYSDGRREQIDPLRVKIVDGGYLVEVDRGVTLKSGDTLSYTAHIKKPHGE